jgi:hypothetical protein
VSDFFAKFIFYSIKMLFIVKPIMTESTDLKNHFNQSKLQQWRPQKRYSTSTSTFIVNNQSETSSSFEICIPFNDCSTQMNRTVLIILVLAFIFTCCCYYQCYEYCTVKHELDEGKLCYSQNNRCTDVFIHNNGFVT